MASRRRLACVAFVSWVFLCVGCANREGGLAAGRSRLSDAAHARSAGGQTSWPCYTLQPDRWWHLDPPQNERFDASGLLWTREGELLTVNDRGPEIFRIEISEQSSAAPLKLIDRLFAANELARFAGEKRDRYDCEGIAQDERGRIYLCEEANRWVLSCDPDTGGVERLPIDWKPLESYFSASDHNASFEGIAIGDGVLYLANERSVGRIVAVDLQTRRILSHFSARPAGSRARDVHYSDLSWFDGALYVLLRESRCVLKVDPKQQRVLAQYDFRSVEERPELKYRLLYPTGNMEGLAVTREFIWLLTDNNGLGRVRYPNDRRPTLFRCRKPDV